MKNIPDFLRELCRCGVTKWFHEASGSKRCPRNPGRMDWIDGTTFVGTGAKLSEEETEAQHHGRDQEGKEVES